MTVRARSKSAPLAPASAGCERRAELDEVALTALDRAHKRKAKEKGIEKEKMRKLTGDEWRAEMQRMAAPAAAYEAPPHGRPNHWDLAVKGRVVPEPFPVGMAVASNSQMAT